MALVAREAREARVAQVARQKSIKTESGGHSGLYFFMCIWEAIGHTPEKTAVAVGVFRVSVGRNPRKRQMRPAVFSFQSAAIHENGKCGRRFLDFSRLQSPKMTNAADFGCLIAGRNPRKRQMRPMAPSPGADVLRKLNSGPRCGKMTTDKDFYREVECHEIYVI